MRRCWQEQFFKVFYRDNGLGIKFEYAGPRDSQRNGRVEMKFQTIYGQLSGQGQKVPDKGCNWAWDLFGPKAHGQEHSIPIYSTLEILLWKENELL
jgi:hypothetical protein